MVYFSDQEIDAWLNDDMPVLDLTTELMGIGSGRGEIRCRTREFTVLCGTEEVARMWNKLGLQISEALPSGTALTTGQEFMIAHGSAEALHAGWRAGVNLMEHASGIATRTRKMVDAVQKVAPEVGIVTTRKLMPGTKKMSIKATLCGGAMPHRLGLSETILIFDEHLRFLPNREQLPEYIANWKLRASEKLIAIEAHEPAAALALAHAGADIVQLDKFSCEATAQTAKAIHSECPDVKVSIAGGVNLKNCEAYAATGVDMIVTSSLYFGKPADIKADLRAVK
jgi:molybdenum transport protein